MSFSELGLSEKVLEAVEAAGYTSPTPIQAQAIPPALAGRDVLGIAQTGTGKTAAFTLPMLNRLETGRARARMPRTLILEPTRELAAQVEESFVKLGAAHKLSVALLIGGVSFADQDAKITRGVDVLIATPGRLLDHFERGKLLLTGIEVLVIDEADRMLDMGFIPDIERICKMVPFTRQTLFFSATMPPEIQQLTEAFLSNPVKVEVARPASTASTITQRLVASSADARAKREVLRRLIREAQDLQNAIIFCNRKRDVALLHRSLERHGFNVVALHGDMDQRSRMQALDSFRNGAATLLVASDVAARGLDIPEVSHVFNFDVPFHAEDYVHRIGRTGRAGRSGHAASIVTTDDVKALAAIEALTGKPIEWEGQSLDEFIADQPDTEETSARRERGRGSSRSEGRDRRERDRRDQRPGDARGSARTSREPPARREPSRQEPSARREPGRNEPARHEPVRHQPIRAGDRPVYSRTGHDDDSPVVGFGDHIPAFLLKKVVLGPPSDNLDGEEFDDIELTVTDTPEVQETADEPAEPGRRESGRRRSRKKRTIDISTPADTRAEADIAPEITQDVAPEAASGTAIEAETTARPETEAVTEAIAGTAPAEPAPAAHVVEETAEDEPKKPVRRTRRKAAAETAPAEPAAEVVSADTAPAAEAVPAETPPTKPVRRRTRKTEAAAATPADTEADATDAPATAEAIKPVRTRRTRSKPATPADAESATAQVATAETGAEEAPAKPVRKRVTRKKADAETAGATTTDATAGETGTGESSPVPKRTRRKTAVAQPASSEADGAAGTEPVTDDRPQAGAQPSDA